MSIDEAVLADLIEQRSKVPFDHTALEPEEVELIVAEIKKQVWKLERMCSSIIGHPHGINPAALSTLQTLKVLTAQLVWHLKQAKPAPEVASGPEAS